MGGNSSSKTRDHVGSDPNRVQGMARLMTARPQKRRPKNVHPLFKLQMAEEEQYDHEKQSMYLLKHLFKKMDPTVMKTISDVRGEIKLSFKYDKYKTLLLIKLVSAKELVPKDLSGKAANPYVKFELIPDQTSEGAKTSSAAENTLYPTYNEIFTFKLLEEDVSDSKLRVQVWDKDIFGKDDFMGEKIVNLSEINFKEVFTNWYELQAETDLSITGSLEISLGYRLPQTLLVTVHRANDLVRRDPGHDADPYVKIMVPGLQEIYKTTVAKSTLDPEWEETFELDVPQEELTERYIVFHILDMTGDNESMGQVCVDLENLNIEEGYHGKFELADLKNHHRVRSKWSQKALVQEFKEAMYAHAVYKYPAFLFQKQEGNKVLTVENKHAGTSTKLRIVDGVPL
ncbi:synaptotagmin-1-like [Ptychodera flava]|uniref:synaptotagmin-1-like n=1 Tax=Ptychodera flava TaxID=63121 RepID=UPI00396A608A